MKTSMILISAVLAGSTAWATGGTNSTHYDSYQDTNAVSASDRKESAYDSAIKPDRTMRHTTREGRASNEYNQNNNNQNNNIDRTNWDRDGYRTNQNPDTQQ
jgi:hypothetical protein